MKARQLPPDLAKQLRQQNFLAELARQGLPLPAMEYKFHPRRKWRADYAWPEYRVLLEQEGGVWVGGRHTRGKGFVADMKKYNAAAMLGFKVLRYTVQEMDQLVPIQELMEVLR